MIVPVTASEQLLFSTVRIECASTAGQGSVGTGFIFRFPTDDSRVIPAIVTNRHVVQGAQVCSFRLHQAKAVESGSVPTGASKAVVVNDAGKAWISHPNPEIDLCAMPFQQVRASAEAQGWSVYTRELGAELVPSEAQLDELSAVEDVLMVGYPIDVWDRANNLPIFRRGITASHPAVDFDGKSQGLIDAACFPGSSGSPVVLLNEGIYAVKGQGTAVGSRVLLLGVLASGPLTTTEGRIVIRDLPTAIQPVPVIGLMANLGFYVKSREILELGKHVRTILRV